VHITLTLWCDRATIIAMEKQQCLPFACLLAYTYAQKHKTVQCCSGNANQGLPLQCCRGTKYFLQLSTIQDKRITNIDNQLDATITVSLTLSISSTRFGQLFAHLQEH